MDSSGNQSQVFQFDFFYLALPATTCKSNAGILISTKTEKTVKRGLVFEPTQGDPLN